MTKEQELEFMDLILRLNDYNMDFELSTLQNLLTKIEAYKDQSVKEERLKHCLHENTKVNGFGTKRYCCECEMELPLDFSKLN